MFEHDVTSLGLSLLKPSAPISLFHLPDHILEEVRWTSEYATKEVEAGRYTPQMAYAEDRGRFLDLSVRACFVVGEAPNPDLNFNIDSFAIPYIREHYDVGDNLVTPGLATLLHNPVGGGIGLHTDSVRMGAAPTRVAIAMCYLNDDFEGGDIEFPEHGFRHSPKTGDVLVFPTCYPHIVHPLTSGKRNTIQRGYVVRDTTGKHTI